MERKGKKLASLKVQRTKEGNVKIRSKGKKVNRVRNEVKGQNVGVKKRGVARTVKTKTVGGFEVFCVKQCEKLKAKKGIEKSTSAKAKGHVYTVPIRIFRCRVCQKVKRTLDSVVKHLRKEHKGRILDDDDDDDDDDYDDLFQKVGKTKVKKKKEVKVEGKIKIKEKLKCDDIKLESNSGAKSKSKKKGGEWSEVKLKKKKSEAVTNGGPRFGEGKEQVAEVKKKKRTSDVVGILSPVKEENKQTSQVTKVKKKGKKGIRTGGSDVTGKLELEEKQQQGKEVKKRKKQSQASIEGVTIRPWSEQDLKKILKPRIEPVKGSTTEKRKRKVPKKAVSKVKDDPMSQKEVYDVDQMTPKLEGEVKKGKLTCDASTTTTDLIPNQLLNGIPLSSVAFSTSPAASSVKTQVLTGSNEDNSGSRTSLGGAESDYELERTLAISPTDFHQSELNSLDVNLALKALDLRLSVSEKGGQLNSISLTLTRERMNEISITPKDNGKLEVLYTGLEQDDMDDPGMVNGYTPEKPPKRPKYSEWRKEEIEVVQTGKGNLRGSSSTCSSLMPSLHPTTLCLPVSDPYVFNVQGIKDDLHSILDVLKGQKMSTNSLDAYIWSRVLFHQSQQVLNSSSVIFPTFEFLSVHFLPVHVIPEDMRQLKPNMRYFPRSKFHQATVIAPLFAVDHYYLAVFHFPTKTAYLYDSFWDHLRKELRFIHVVNVLKSLCRYYPLPQPDLGEGWVFLFQTKCAQQSDDSSCGYFVARFAENHMAGKPQRSELKMGKGELLQVRHAIVKELLPTTNIGQEILNAISPE